MLRLEALGPGVAAELTMNGRVKGALRLYRPGPEGGELLVDVANILSEKERTAITSKLPLELQDDALKVLVELAKKLYARLEEAEGEGVHQRQQGGIFADEVEEVWQDQVDGAELLGELIGTLTSFLVLPPGAALAMALWVLHAHAIDAAEISPLLAFGSPEKRCGKTTALRLVSALVPRPLLGSNVTPAAVYRAIDAFGPSLLIDEADTFLRDADELRGILNASHDRGSARVVRVEKVGDTFEPRALSTWCPKAVAMIGELPETLADRSVRIRMRRRARGEEVKRFRLDRLKDLGPLRQRAARWVQDAMQALRDADPAIPSELHDRAADNWRPLLAIADAIGEPWGAQAREAALQLTQQAGEETAESARILLLADLRRMFAERQVDRLASTEIVAELVRREDRPWSEWSKGRPLTPRNLAALLKPFAIEPGVVRGGNGIFRGYLRSAFVDAWDRYLPSESVTSVTSPADNGLAGGESVTPPSAVTGGGSRMPLPVHDVTGVTDMDKEPFSPGDAWEGPGDA